MGKFGEALTSSLGQTASQAGGGILSNLVNRIFNKKDRKINWQESQRYGERNLEWEKQMQEFNQMNAHETAEYNQGLSKQFYDYTAKYESPEQQMKRLKEAGLNPAMLYGESGTGGGSGTTGGAQATTAMAKTPQETYRPMGGQASGIMQLRETSAERELKLAQAENLRSEVEEREGVGRELKEAQTTSILTGVNSERAKEALTRAQTLGEELKTKLLNAQYDDLVDITTWTGKRMAKEFSIAEDEEYVSRETREEKINLLRQTLTNSVIEAELRKSQIGQILKQGQKTDADITKIASDISQGLAKLKQGERGLDIEEAKLTIQETVSKYVGLDKLGGRILDEALRGMIKTINMGLGALGLGQSANW